MINKKHNLIIAIDFDGTCVAHRYPAIGPDIGAVPVLKKLVEDGHRLVLNTMRSGRLLDEAVEWFKTNGIELYGVNHTPGQDSWTSSSKTYAQLYIDDAAVGCPLVITNTRPYVDWKQIAYFFGYNYSLL